jgi:hypothetical protein
MFAGLPPSSSELTNGRALFRHLPLQIGGANIENPPPSSSLAEERTARQCLLLAPLAETGARASLAPCGGARLPTLAAVCLNCSRIALWIHRRRRRSQRKERLASVRCSLRSLRLAHAPAWLRAAARDYRRSQLENRGPAGLTVRLRPQPRLISIRREAASSDGFGIRISRTPSL